MRLGRMKMLMEGCIKLWSNFLHSTLFAISVATHDPSLPYDPPVYLPTDYFPPYPLFVLISILLTHVIVLDFLNGEG